MGKSRSATVVIAYLMQLLRITPTEALSQLREGRGVCDPNDGFKHQLELYHRMDMTDKVEEHPVYQTWLYERELNAARACNQAPDADKIRFIDEHAAPAANNADMRCRKCRCVGQSLGTR